MVLADKVRGGGTGHIGGVDGAVRRTPDGVDRLGSGSPHQLKLEHHRSRNVWRQVWHPTVVRSVLGGSAGRGATRRNLVRRLATLPLRAVPERGNDTGGRCALRSSGNAHRRSRPSAGAGTSFGLTAPFSRGALAGQAVTLATHLARGARYGFGGRCVCAPLPPTLGVATEPAIRAGRRRVSENVCSGAGLETRRRYVRPSLSAVNRRRRGKPARLDEWNAPSVDSVPPAPVCRPWVPLEACPVSQPGISSLLREPPSRPNRRGSRTHCL